MKRTAIGIIVPALVLCVFTESLAYAYLDAGSGSMLVQLLLGGVAGAGMMVKLLWRKFRDRWSRSAPKK